MTITSFSQQPMGVQIVLSLATTNQQQRDPATSSDLNVSMNVPSETDSLNCVFISGRVT